jgi:hypothetical protein
MGGKLDQDAAKVKIESDLARLTSVETRNTLPTRRRASAAAPNGISLMHQLLFSILFIRLIPALGTGGGRPAHA